MRTSEITLRGLAIFTAILLAVVLWLLTANYHVAAVHAAANSAEQAFAQAHPYNASVLHKLERYHRETEKANGLSRPEPVWQPTACETQTLDWRDRSRLDAGHSVKPHWAIPAGLAQLIVKPVAPVASAAAAAPYTPDCELERAQFASEKTRVG